LQLQTSAPTFCIELIRGTQPKLIHITHFTFTGLEDNLQLDESLVLSGKSKFPHVLHSIAAYSLCHIDFTVHWWYKQGTYLHAVNFFSRLISSQSYSIFLREDYYKEVEIRQFHGQGKGKLLTERDERCPTSERVATMRTISAGGK
jgi:hypothetical protein